jgi:RNA polymerase sigma-70 factor (ECF subfamily)
VKQLDDIIKGCISRKREYQAKLYKLYAKKMFGVCVLYTKDYTEAEDVVQDGFVKIFQNIKQFNNSGSFEGWMRRIMVNTALEKYRKQHRLYAVNDIEPYINDISYGDVIDKLSAADLMKLIQELSPQYRIVFTLYAIEGYPHKEIAVKLGISEGTSKSNLSRARNILKNKVEKHYYYERRQSNRQII